MNQNKMLKGKKVLLGVTASIAAYKSAELVRLFKKAGASVRIIQTEASLQFVSPLTLTTLSEYQVLTKMVDSKSGEWSNHVELGLWADLMVIAPLTANTMAKMKAGECDNLLLATYLSAKCPVYFAPAMDLDMYKHPSTKANISNLEEYGNILIPSGFGELASALIGEGRMAEPQEIIEHITADLSKELPLNNKRVLITAGPTYEAIDPVRFIGNRSSGKMGIALSIESANRGAKVDLVLGPSALYCTHSNIKVHRIQSASEMHTKVDALFAKSNISIFAAAVADYAPKTPAKQKIKKGSDSFSLELEQTKDILSLMCAKKTSTQFVVGFALETENEIENAMSKLDRKNLDMIVLNSLNNKGAGFECDTNKITIIDKANNITDFKLKDKSEVAKDIINMILKQI
jgi:phosphopantothenoylcysteine decarboxylase/phosphopantothenate--cysteine ligase